MDDKAGIVVRTVAVRLQRWGGVAAQKRRLQRRNDLGNGEKCPESLAVAVQRATADRRRVHRVDGRRACDGRAQGMSGLEQALPHCACATHVWSVRPVAGATAHRRSYARLRSCCRADSGTRAARDALRSRSRTPSDSYSRMMLVLYTEVCRKGLWSVYRKGLPSRARTPTPGPSPGPGGRAGGRPGPARGRPGRYRPH